MELRELFATFGLEFDQKSVDAAEGGLSKLQAGIKSFGAAIASTVVLKGLTEFVLGISHAAQEISNLSQRAGVSTAEIQQMGAALAPLGLNLESTSKLFEELNIRAAQAAQGGGPAQTFRDLGVSVKDSAGNVRSGSELFLEVTDRIAAMGSASDRTNALNQLMAEQGRRLGPALSEGNNQLREMVANMEGLEGITPDVIAQSQELTGQMARFDLVTTSLKNELARELLPVFIKALSALKGFTQGIVQVVRQSNIMKAVLVTLGTALVAWGIATASAWAPTALLFAGIALAIAAVVLIVDDLITMFSGGESAIGDFLDAQFGIGTSAEVVDTLTQAWEGLKLAISDLGGWISSYPWGDAWTGLKMALTDLQTWLMGIWNSFVAGATVASLRIKAIFNALKSALQAAFNVVMFPINAAIAAYNKIKGETATDSRVGSEPRTNVRGFARAPASASAPTSTNSRSAQTTISQSTQVPITIVGNPSREEVARLQRIVEETIDQRNRDALSSLVPEPA